MSCPCGAVAPYAECCGPRHDGTRPPETAEALMRSRYTAFTMSLGEYIVATGTRSGKPNEAAELTRWTRSVGWLGLTVLGAERGQPGDTEGHVHFVARLVEGGQLVSLEERSRFLFEQGRWRYVEGTAQTSTKRLARNEPCPCGSGKKLKQCHR